MPTHPTIQRSSHTGSHPISHTGERTRVAHERVVETVQHAAKAREAHQAQQEKVSRLQEQLALAKAKKESREQQKEKGKETEQERQEREREEREIVELEEKLRTELPEAERVRLDAQKAAEAAAEAQLEADAADDAAYEDLKNAAQNGPNNIPLRKVDPKALDSSKSAVLNTSGLSSAQAGSNQPAGVAAPSNQYAPGPVAEGVSGPAPKALSVYDSVTQRINRPGEAGEPVRTTNVRRYFALMGIGTVLAGLAGSLAYMTYLYLTVKKVANDEPPPEGLPPDKEKALADRIREWLKATAKDADFWESFAKLAVEPKLDPPLTLTDHILFCSYVIDHYPVNTFLFDEVEDVILYEMHLVAAYAKEADDGKAFQKGAAAMYRKVFTLMYSAGGMPEAPFPRQVQALLLRRAFVSLSVPSPAVDLMALAVELAENNKLTDADYWKKFTDYRSGSKDRPPLTLGDEMQFCGYTAALLENTGFYFERKETAPDFIAQLVAKFDTQTKSTAGLYALAPTLSVTPGTPLPRRVQAQLLRAALTQLDTKDSGTGLPALVQQWAAKSDADYWAEFVKYKQAARPPLLLTEEIHFCTYTLRQFPVPAAYIPPTPDEREAFVTRLVNQYKTDSSTTGAYPLLTRLRDRPPQLPRAVQAQVMRLALMQISDAAGV